MRNVNFEQNRGKLSSGAGEGARLSLTFASVGECKLHVNYIEMTKTFLHIDPHSYSG